MAVFTIAALRTELDTDPKGLGYAARRAQSNAPEALAARLNERGASAESVTQTYLRVEDVVAALVRAEYDALSAAGKDYLGVVLSAPQVKTGDATLRAQLGQLFGAGTTTRTNLLALATRSASRAEVLWGEGFAVTDAQAADALSA
jgi:cytochrome P450